MYLTESKLKGAGFLQVPKKEISKARFMLNFTFCIISASLFLMVLNFLSTTKSVNQFSFISLLACFFAFLEIVIFYFLIVKHLDVKENNKEMVMKLANTFVVAMINRQTLVIGAINNEPVFIDDALKYDFSHFLQTLKCKFVTHVAFVPILKSESGRVAFKNSPLYQIIKQMLDETEKINTQSQKNNDLAKSLLDLATTTNNASDMAL